MTVLKSAFDRVSSVAKRYHIRAIYLLFILYIIGVSIYKPSFLTLDNWLNIIRQVAVYGIISCGITFVMLTGRTELSAGMMITLLAAISCYFVTPNVDNQFLAILLPLVLGLVFGLLNGILVGIVKLNSFVATLGMMSLFSGGVLMFMKNVGSLNGSIDMEVYKFIGQGSVLGIPIPAIIFIIIVVLSSLVLKKTVFGARIYAVGSNPVSARFSGIKTSKIVVTTYIISGFTTGIGALVMCSRIMSAQPKMGAGYEFTALTAIVLGGLSIMGGKGTILGTTFGVLVLGTLDNRFTIMGVDSSYQYIVKGIILSVAVAAQLIGERRNGH